jgi:hypothetical protein
MIWTAHNIKHAIIDAEPAAEAGKDAEFLMDNVTTRRYLRINARAMLRKKLLKQCAEPRRWSATIAMSLSIHTP